MALKMTNHKVNGVSVVARDGRIVLGGESNALREKLKSSIPEGKRKIVPNMLQAALPARLVVRFAHPRVEGTSEKTKKKQTSKRTARN